MVTEADSCKVDDAVQVGAMNRQQALLVKCAVSAIAASQALCVSRGTAASRWPEPQRPDDIADRSRTTGCSAPVLSGLACLPRQAWKKKPPPEAHPELGEQAQGDLAQLLQAVCLVAGHGHDDELVRHRQRVVNAPQALRLLDRKLGPAV